MPMTSAKSTAAPASITHHSVAIELDAGPRGSSVDSGPAQPHSIAMQPAWIAARKALRCRCERCQATWRTTNMANTGERQPPPRSEVLLELQRLDVGSAVAACRSSAPRDDGAFPGRVRGRDAGRRRLLLVVGRSVLAARGHLVGRRRVLDRRRPRASSGRGNSCSCAASACTRRAGRMPLRR